MSDSDRLKPVIIIGSIRHGRVGPAVAEWFAATAHRRADLQVDVIDLAEACLPEVLSDTDPKPQPVQVLAPWLAAADAFVVVTPEYNRGFPGPLKTAIDWYQHEWKGKPVGFASYGSGTGGLYAVEQLRQVFNELHAVTVRDIVGLDRRHDLADARDRERALRRGGGATTMLDQLTWWARALRPARAEHPCPF